MAASFLARIECLPPLNFNCERFAKKPVMVDGRSRYLSESHFTGKMLDKMKIWVEPRVNKLVPFTRDGFFCFLKS